MERTSDGRFQAGRGGVVRISATRDRKAEFILFDNGTRLVLVPSAMGYPAYYPLSGVRVDRPLRAVLMDLDGTTVRSEHFWIWIIEKTVASLLGAPRFRLEAQDEPHVSGHSVSEHLQYCIGKYCPDRTVEEARLRYFEHTRFEMAEILAGRGRRGAFTPAPGIREFLLALKDSGLKIGLVTSGLHEKAWPEIVDAFNTLELGSPEDFYDAIITAGQAIRPGQPGTLGELCPKPHPWLYAEAARIGLGIPFEERGRVVGIEDSGAGVLSILLAGFAPIGIGGGNIQQSGTRSLCSFYGDSLAGVLEWLLDKDVPGTPQTGRSLAQC